MGRYVKKKLREYMEAYPMGPFPSPDKVSMWCDEEDAALTAAEAAVKLGIAERTVRKHCVAGLFPGAVNGGGWRIPVEDIKNWTKPRKGWVKGKPRKKVQHEEVET